MNPDLAIHVAQVIVQCEPYSYHKVILLYLPLFCVFQELMAVDHNKIYYAPFRKNFYMEVPEIANMTQEGACKLSRNSLSSS